MIAGVIQVQTDRVYAANFKVWSTFVRLCGFLDPFLPHLSYRDLIVFICNFAAWARTDGRWGGSTTIQALSAIRHTFRSQFCDFTPFNYGPAQQLLHALQQHSKQQHIMDPRFFARKTLASFWAKQRASRTATACFAEGVERLATGEISTTPEFWVVGFTLGSARNHASIHFRLSELSAV